MVKFTKGKMYFLWLTVASCIYLTCCPLLFQKQIYTIIINHIPYAVLFVVDCIIIRNKRNDLTSIIKEYVGKNRLLFLTVIIFVLYDMVTIIYAQTPSYSFMKYLVFVKMVFLVLSIFLCIYEKETSFWKKNLEFLIRSIGWIVSLILITTIIEWSLGLTPYVKRISTIEDYNIYASYLLFTLLFFAYYHLEKKDNEAGKKKIIYASVGIIAFSFLFLSGSRRAVMLAPIMLAIYVFAYIIKERVTIHESTLVTLDNRRRKKHIYFLALICILVTCTQASVPIFERVISVDCVSEREGINRGGSLASRYDTINLDKGFASRDLIWNVAISEIKDYNTVELLFGKGNGYGWNVYEDIDNKGVEELSLAYDLEELKSKWMSPHNLVLKEFLEGGLIKISVLLSLAIVIIVTVFKIIKKYFLYGMLLLSVYICQAGNFVLGGTYGLLGEDLFWLVTAVLIVVNTLRLRTIEE